MVSSGKVCVYVCSQICGTKMYSRRVALNLEMIPDDASTSGRQICEINGLQKDGE